MIFENFFREGGREIPKKTLTTPLESGMIHLALRRQRLIVKKNQALADWKKAEFWGFQKVLSYIWGYSSAGRALEWHSRGQRFDPAYLHHSKWKGLFLASERKRGFFMQVSPDAQSTA